MLIVEDNPFMQQTIQQMLNQINVEFEEAYNGNECI
jgi:CheY-like chemotaxis protein